MGLMDIVGKSKEDVSLPKATMFKLIKEMLLLDVRIARDGQDLLVEGCVGISPQQDSPKGKWPIAAVMTEKEALAAQQKMAAEAHARMNGGAVNVPSNQILTGA